MVLAETPASGKLDGVAVGLFVGEGVNVGVAFKVGVGVVVSLGVAVGLRVGVGVEVGLVVGVAEGVETKAGSSAARTTNERVKVLKIPLASLHESVMLCVPGKRSSGGLQFHSPLSSTVTWSVIGSDSTVMVMTVSGGPSPKNSGWVEATTSPLSTLSKVTVEGSKEASSSGVSNPEDSWPSGTSNWAWGTPDSILGGRFLKSWLWPRTIGGAGFADAG
jgi:hypothetical protein